MGRPLPADGRSRLAQVRRSLAAAEARLLTDLDDQNAEQLRTLLSRVAQTARRVTIALGEADR